MYTFDNAAEWSSQDKQALGFDFPNLPYVIDGDVKITESAAVTIYLCDKYAPELMGTTPEQRAKIMMLHLVLKDHWQSYHPIATMKGATQEAMADKAMESWPKIAAVLGANNYLVGNSVTVADIIMFEMIEFTLAICRDKRLYTTCPNLEAFNARIKAIPTLAAYFASPEFVSAFYPPFVPVEMIIQE